MTEAMRRDAWACDACDDSVDDKLAPIQATATFDANRPRVVSWAVWHCMCIVLDWVL
jgi:hypothetical protein